MIEPSRPQIGKCNLNQHSTRANKKITFIADVRVVVQQVRSSRSSFFHLHHHPHHHLNHHLHFLYNHPHRHQQDHSHLDRSHPSCCTTGETCPHPVQHRPPQHCSTLPRCPCKSSIEYNKGQHQFLQIIEDLSVEHLEAALFVFSIKSVLTLDVTARRVEIYLSG